MNKNLMQEDRIDIKKRGIGYITLWGLLIRIALLALMLALEDTVSPYFIKDDIAYEVTAKEYLKYSKGILDFAYLEEIADAYLQPFWPIVMCISAAMFKTIYMGRVINIFLSTACIPVIYKTTLLLSQNEKSARLAGKLFAFLPVTIMTCCFPIKDIYLTWAILYAFYVFLLIYQREKVGLGRILLCIAGLVGVYHTRGAVTELMVIFFTILWIESLWKKKKYLAVVGVVILALAAIFLYGATAVDAFTTKIEDYGGYNEASDGGLSMLQMTSAAQFYKMPFAYFFATFQPMTLNYLAAPGDSLWMYLMRLLNVSIYPVAIANMLYVFKKKHNFMYWICGVVIYCAIISMVLGVFRHYLFLIPLEMINCALCFDKKSRSTSSLVLLGSLGIAVAVALYTLLIYI